MFVDSVTRRNVQSLNSRFQILCVCALLCTTTTRTHTYSLTYSLIHSISTIMIFVHFLIFQVANHLFTPKSRHFDDFLRRGREITTKWVSAFKKNPRRNKTKTDNLMWHIISNIFSPHPLVIIFLTMLSLSLFRFF